MTRAWDKMFVKVAIRVEKKWRSQNAAESDLKYKLALLDKYLAATPKKPEASSTLRQARMSFVPAVNRYCSNLTVIMNRLRKHADESDLNKYIRITKKLPLPSRHQVSSFVDYISSAHSWYKDLPRMDKPKGFIFLEPHAGMMQIHQTEMLAIKPCKEKDCWHYSLMPTAEYRKKYGYLSYQFTDRPELLFLYSKTSQKYGDYDSIYFLPKEIIEAGVPVNAYIHPQENNEIERAKQLRALEHSAMRIMKIIKHGRIAQKQEEAQEKIARRRMLTQIRKMRAKE